MGIAPSSKNPLSIEDPSLIAFLKRNNITDKAIVAVDLKVTPSVVFGGFDESNLYPNSQSGVIYWYPSKQSFDLWGLDIHDMHIESDNGFIQKGGFALIDSFFPGIALP